MKLVKFSLIFSSILLAGSCSFDADLNGIVKYHSLYKCKSADNAFIDDKDFSGKNIFIEWISVEKSELPEGNNGKSKSEYIIVCDNDSLYKSPVAISKINTCKNFQNYVENFREYLSLNIHLKSYGDESQFWKPYIASFIVEERCDY